MFLEGGWFNVGNFVCSVLMILVVLLSVRVVWVRYDSWVFLGRFNVVILVGVCINNVDCGVMLSVFLVFLCLVCLMKIIVLLCVVNCVVLVWIFVISG